MDENCKFLKICTIKGIHLATLKTLFVFRTIYSNTNVCDIINEAFNANYIPIYVVNTYTSEKYVLQSSMIKMTF